MSQKSKHIVLAVSGSVAIYKACELASQLTQKGFRVSTALTSSAAKMISPVLFRALTGQAAVVDEFAPNADAPMTHIEFAKCDLFLVAPASADLIGRLAAGMADDLVATTALALQNNTPKLLAPAMNTNMFAHPLLQKNLQILREIGYQIVEPQAGHLACGVQGQGRLADAETIISHAQVLLKNKT